MKIKLCMILVFISLQSIAADGRVMLIKGSATLNNKVLSKSSLLNFGDEIKTEKDSLLIIKLEPNTLIKIKEKTTLKIEKPSVTENKKNYSFALKIGEAFVKAHKTEKTSYSVKTNNAVFGVRGTQFFITSTPENPSWMCVNEGEVEVKLIHNKEKIIVKAGMGVSVEKNKIPTPHKYKWTKNLNWKMEGEINDVIDTVNLESINYKIEEQDYD